MFPKGAEHNARLCGHQDNPRLLLPAVLSRDDNGEHVSDGSNSCQWWNLSGHLGKGSRHRISEERSQPHVQLRNEQQWWAVCLQSRSPSKVQCQWNHFGDCPQRDGFRHLVAASRCERQQREGNHVLPGAGQGLQVATLEGFDNYDQHCWGKSCYSKSLSRKTL